MPAVRIDSIIKSTPELKRLLITLDTSNKNNTSVNTKQILTPLAEIFRMSSLRHTTSQPAITQNADNTNMIQNKQYAEIRAIVADTVNRLTALYGGTSFLGASASHVQDKETEIQPRGKSDFNNTRSERDEIEKNTKPKNDKLPPSVPPNAPTNNTILTQGNPGQVIPQRDPSLRMKAEQETENEKNDKKKESTIREDKSDEMKLQELNELRNIETAKRLKEEKFLKVLKVYTISGRITDDKSGNGISGVFVNGGDLGTTLTDGAGEFNFYNVPKGKIYSINVKKNAYNFTPSTITDTADAPNRHHFYGNKLIHSLVN